MDNFNFARRIHHLGTSLSILNFHICIDQMQLADDGVYRINFVCASNLLVKID